MGWSEPEDCCCCCPLRKGCLIIGYIKLITYSLIALILCVYLGQGPHLDTMDIDGNIDQPPSTWIIVLALLMSIFLTFVYVCLLVGVYTKRPHFVRSVYLTLGTLTFIGFLTSIFMMPIGGIIGMILDTVFQIYLILCIRAYYLTMMDETSVAQGVV